MQESGNPSAGKYSDCLFILQGSGQVPVGSGRRRDQDQALGQASGSSIETASGTWASRFLKVYTFLIASSAYGK